jgi:hypothetical protein
MAAFGGNESCPNCNARMAADQRYCLNCGHRRGDPRLPFMDAVVFMESMNAPGGAGGAATPPPPPAQSGDNNRWNANAALIAGVATLVLAIGVGFLIGRSGHDNAPQAQAPQVIKVEGGTGGGGEEAAPATPEDETTPGKESGGKSEGGGKGAKSKGKAPAKKKASEVKEGSKEEQERAEEKTKEVLHSTEPTLESGAQLGEKCDPSVAGCSASGKVDGNFFE